MNNVVPLLNETHTLQYHNGVQCMNRVDSFSPTCTLLLDTTDVSGLMLLAVVHHRHLYTVKQMVKYLQIESNLPSASTGTSGTKLASCVWPQALHTSVMRECHT